MDIRKDEINIVRFNSIFLDGEKRANDYGKKRKEEEWNKA